MTRDSTFTCASTVLSQKEAEMMTLKNQLVELKPQHKLRRTTDMIGDPWKLTATPFVPVAFEPQPFPQTLSQTTSPSLSLWSHEQQNIRQLTKFTPKASRSPTLPVDSSPHDVSSDVSASSKAPAVFPISPCLPNLLSSFLSGLTMTNNSPSPLTVAPILNPQSPQYSDDLNPVDTFEHLFMTEDSGIHVEHLDEMDSNYSSKPNQSPDKAFPRSDSKIFFTFDDIGPSKWCDRSFEMLSWMTAELQFYSIYMVIKRLLSRLQGRLLDWYNSLGEYRQLTIQIEFVGIDDVNLKGVFLNSFPESLANEVKRFLDDRNVTIAQTTLGELYQLILNALNRLCNQQKFKMEFKKTVSLLPTDEAILSLPYLDYSSDEDSDPYQPRSGVFMINLVPPNVEKPSIFKNPHFLGIQPYPRQTTKPRPIPHLLPIQRTQPMPLAKVHLLTDVYSKPIPVIAFFDISSFVSIIDPNILPARFWKPHYQMFYAANGQTFVVNKISIPINIRLFLRCVYGTGLRYKSFFNPYSPVQRVCMTTLVSIDTIWQSIIQTSCANSHTEFLKKNPSPLWLNPDFFVELPFKQNEDVNPTKASHPGMNPDHYQLAVQECVDLVEQGVIESTTSPWACEVFYVNKRNEQTHGKLRLVINYQPLNHFLADDKFPLPQKKSLFQSLVDAKVMSKFDLKFDENYHMVLLSKFHDLVRKYGIMLSESKMEVGVSSIEFLGMKISDGKYQPEPHIAKELVHFLDELRSQKEIQQFLGVVNYMSDFLPKLSTHTVWLFPMLKKNPPTWTKKQTEVVREIKKLADVMPPLKIPSTNDKRILQTDASDDYWGAVLLVEDSSSVRSICGYKSGTFKASEQHYHSTFKEILAVKRGIEKFQFHLIGHEFLIEMDMASFPRMLQFKQKMLHEAQLLRWANWFSHWKFTVKHIKGTDNVLAYFLSRPRDYKSKAIPSPSSRSIKMVHLIEIEENFGSTSAELPLSLPKLVELWCSFGISLRLTPLPYPLMLPNWWNMFSIASLTNPLLNQIHQGLHEIYSLSLNGFFMNQPQLYHSPLSFIHEWSDVNPTDDLCILKNSSMYFRLRRCLAHANRVDPATIPTDIMHELISWSDSDLVSSHSIQALEEWKRTHLQPHIDTSDDDIDSDAESGYYIEHDEPYFDPYEDDPSHEDSRWK
ncbi:hypothetical protein LXL04_015802 [Taraxacum kok-saghyz]